MPHPHPLASPFLHTPSDFQLQALHFFHLELSPGLAVSVSYSFQIMHLHLDSGLFSVAVIQTKTAHLSIAKCSWSDLI